MFFKFVALCSLAAVAFAYPKGAPAGSCVNLTPKHGVGAQNSASNHVVHTSANAIRSGAPTSVHLQGDAFRGFLLVARDAGTEQAVPGSWAAVDGNAKALDCGLTHTSNNPKTQVSGQFTPAANFQGQIVFRAAVVQDIENFWNNVASEIISVY